MEGPSGVEEAALRSCGVLDEADLIKYGDRVILEWEEGKGSLLVTLKKGSNLKLLRGRVDPSGLIGYPFGSFFELQHKKNLVHKPGKSSFSDMLQVSGDVAESSVVLENNRTLMDLGAKNQKLTPQDIQRMKEENLDAGSIIQKLVEHSDTFGDKTAFSKEKYLIRKRRKYAPVICASKPTPFTLAQHYFLRKPEKILNLRPDSLAFMLQMANVHAFSQALVIDDTMGLLTSSVAERVGGFGRVFSAYTGPCMSTGVLQASSLTECARESIVCIPLEQLNDVDYRAFPTDKESEAAAFQQEKQDPIHRDFSNWKRVYSRERRRFHPEDVNRFIAEGFDSLVMVSCMDPDGVFAQCESFLRPGSSFAIFCQYVQPLAKLYQRLRESQSYCRMQLVDLWTRKYQILPQRCHPLMNTSASSGWLLSGIKVCNFEDEEIESGMITWRKQSRPYGVKRSATTAAAAVEEEKGGPKDEGQPALKRFNSGEMED